MKLKRAKPLAATTCALSAFLSRPVLAEGLSCEVHNAQLFYRYGNAIRSALIAEFTGRLGQLLTLSCSAKYTILVLEKGIARTGGGDAVAERNSTYIFDKKTNRYKIGDVKQFERGKKAVAAKIEWGRVAAVLLNDKSIVVVKNLRGDSISMVRSPPFNFINLSEGLLDIRGSEKITKVAISSGGRSIVLTVSGIKAHEISVKESISE